MSMIGKTLGTFECTALLGKGGMGEVYKAKDQKLGRDVAIKVLPEEFAEDADRVARFQREAKLLASLNHPNIAAIHGLEESDGTHFLVLELIEGDTLADRLKRGAIPVEESLKLALQIAEALEAAHEKGVIHRDLKPANIKVTPDGKVKVLDFGLAKAFAGEQAEVNLSHSPTLSEAATLQGVILGTAAYMSPEQARGKPVDKRTDIWAFGCVLYEMLTGQAAFQGDDVTEILAAVVKLDANLDLLPANLHPRVPEVLSCCLEKNLKDRYRDIGDVKLELAKAHADEGGVFQRPVPILESRTKLRTMMPWIVAAVILTAIIAGIAGLLFWPTPPQPRITQFAVELAGEQIPFLHAVALSPDGTRFVYRANNQLYVHALDQMVPTPIPGTEDGADPYFSPDGESIAFSTPTQLKTVSLTGVAPVVLADVGEGGTAGHALVGAWDSQNRIFFGQGGSYGLSQVPVGGGTPAPFAELGDHSDLDYPDVLPGGEWVLFTDKVAEGGWSNANIVAQSTVTGDRKVVLKGGHFARYAPTGHVVYIQNGTLLAVGFDSDNVEVTGKAVPLVQNVSADEMGGHAQYAIAANGTLIYVPGTIDTSTPRRTLVWVDRQGKEEPIAAGPNDYRSPRISPDGTKVALNINTVDASDIWTWDLIRETMTRLTFNEESGGSVWTHDGQRIAFVSGDKNEPGVYWKAADGTGNDELISSVPDEAITPYSWSSDGKTLVTYKITGSGTDIGSLSLEGDSEWKPLLQKEYMEFQPRISPDGRWIAYSSNESGDFEIYVRPFPEVDEGRWQVSTGGGNTALWSPDGRELFYLNRDSVMAVPVETEPTFRPGKPKALFKGIYVGLSFRDAHTWDISPDGKRFLMMKPPGTIDEESSTEGPPKIHVILNWFEILKQRVPVH